MDRGKRERIHGPYQHKNRWRVVLVGAEGGRVVESFETLTAAEEFAAAARGKTEGRTVSATVDEYELALRARGNKPGSVERARNHLRRLLQLDTNGRKDLGWLTASRAADLYTASQDGAAVATHRNGLNAGKAFGKWCVARKYAKANPFAEVEGVGRAKKGKPQLHNDESERLLAHCFRVGGVPELAIATALGIGSRATETAVLRVRDLDNHGQVIWIEDAKTVAGKRCLRVPEELRGGLLKLAAGRPPSAQLFGDGADRQWLYRHCKRICKAAGVPVIPPHGLRGTLATALKISGMGSYKLADIMGHSSPSQTEDAYLDKAAVAKADKHEGWRLLRGGIA